MILGIGTDIVDVAEMARRIERGRVLRVFSDAELAYADEKPKRRMQTLAARWAAKEAFAKALGTGIRAEWDLAELEVIRGEGGQPELRLGPSLRGLLPDGARVHLTLSHTKTYALAVVLIERAQGQGTGEL
ncbi:MAG TPA: holo-ACP synthase [Candidatus Hydrogenedentes bacterium]|nr:holo-ACP synthase [Candidatus Hydrogenedentota bacterium]HQE82989.1 holo-ACP synthase [Candidatus Hydrogenedentota bacterium]HQH54907.1 holo-ACP synthase [Candidatus Hydrogenedentota bacterium]HQM49396.1 holo-ACP synthase [Candidatus Hydrogenedentota bacterium]